MEKPGILKPQLFDPKTGSPVEISEAEIPAAIVSGKATFLKGDKIAVRSPSGDYGTIPAENAMEAFSSGYKLETSGEQNERILQETYGEGLGNEVRAGLEGGARGLTLGLSDAAMTAMGADKEGLAERQKRNPVSSAVGEVAGVAGPLLIPGGAIAKVASAAPAALANRAGLAVAERVAARIGSEGAQSLAKKIASSAIPAAAGSAVEGAIFGAGQTISEVTLGDPENVAEKLLSNVGMGAVIGSVAGLALGAAGGALKATDGAALPQKIDPSLPAPQRALTKAEEYSQYAGASDIPAEARLVNAVDTLKAPEEAKQSIIEGMQKLKTNADEITEAARLIEAPILESQVSASKQVQRADWMLVTSPTPIGVARSEVLQKGFTAAEKATAQAMGEGGESTLAQVGDKLKQALIGKIEKQNEPIAALYDEIKKTYTAIPVSPKSLPSISKNIMDIEAVSLSKSSPQAGIARRVIEDLPNLKTVDDVKRYKSLLNQTLSATASPAEKHVVAEIAEKLARLEENTILRFAEKQMKTPEAKARIKALLAQRAEANAAYKTLREKTDEVARVLGKKRVRGVGDFTEFVDDLTPEKLASRLFSKNDSEFLKFFSKEFPEETKLLMDFQKSMIKNRHIKDGRLDFGKIIKDVDKLSPEVRAIMFSPEELKRLNAVKVWMESLPPNMNPSGTDMATAYRRFFSNPISAALDTARDAGTLAALKNLVNKAGGPEAGRIRVLIEIEKMARDAKHTIDVGVKGFTRGASKAGPSSVNYLAVTRFDKGSTDRRAGDKYTHFKRKYEEIAEAVSNAEGLSERVSHNLSGVAHSAPNVSAALTMSAINAAQFLYQKAPKDPSVGATILPHLKKWRPSDAEIAKWERYVTAVDHPMSVVRDMSKGVLTSESVEALKVVYPKLYSEISQSLVEHLSELREELPYQKRLQLSLFFGVPVDAATDPAFVAKMQQMHAQAAGPEQQEQSSAKGFAPARVGKIAKAENMQTETERLLNRA